MSEIEHSDLASLITEGIAATPSVYSHGLTKQILDEIESGAFTASNHSVETQSLVRAIEPYSSLICGSAINSLDQCNVVSVPAPVCNASAKYLNDEPYILINDGLLDVAVAAIEMSYVVQSLPDELGEIIPKPDFPDVSALEWITVLLQVLINRFLSHGEPLPNFQVLLSDAAVLDNVRHAFLGTVWWTLLHELGHIKLGHLVYNAKRARVAISDKLVVVENLSVFQEQEFEADAFVYECLTEQGKLNYYSWTNFALGPAMMIETLVSSSKNTHPLSVNRLYKAYELSCGVDTMATELKANDHLERHGAAHTRIRTEHEAIRSRGATPVFSDWSRADLFQALQVLGDLVRDTGIDIDPFTESNDIGWRAKFTSQDDWPQSQ